MSAYRLTSAAKSPRTRQAAAGALVAAVGLTTVAVATPADAAGARAPRVTSVSADAHAAALVWTRTDGAHHYRLRLADNPQMRQARAMNVRTIRARLSDLAANSRYYVEVAAVRPGGHRYWGPVTSVKTKPGTSAVEVRPRPPRSSSTPTPTPTPTPVDTSAPAPVSTPTPTPVDTSSPTPVSTPTPTPVSSPTPTPTPTSTPTTAAASDGSIPMIGWNTPLGTSAALETDPTKNGTANGGVSYAKRFANQAQYTNTTSPVASFYGQGYSTIVDAGSAPVYTVPANQATRKVTWVSGGADAPYDWAAGLQYKLDNVPLPTGPSGQRFEDYYGRSIDAGSGADHQFVVYKPSTKEMWEFWDFRWNATKSRYECGYAGYTPDVTKGSMALPNNWGARATSLPLAGGIMLQSEYAAGEFKHPLIVALPVIKSGWLAPATRQDGGIWPAVVNGDARDAVPEGAWFRLPANYPIDTTKPKLWQMMVKAARDYGIIVGDQTGGSVTFSAEASNAIGTPYSSLSSPAMPVQTTDSNGPFWGKTGVLNTFPWNDLVQVRPPS